jgi:hypothetical protein
MFVGTLAVSIMVVVLHLDVPASGATAKPGGETTMTARASGLPDLRVCLPGTTRCDPANPLVSSGVVPWQEAVVLVGLVDVAIVGVSRMRRPKACARLPRGVQATILRPPQAPLICL